jgi:hypothetical protein
LDIKLKTDTTFNVRQDRAQELKTLHNYGVKVIRLTNDGMFGYITGDAVVDTHDAYEQERIADEKIRKHRDTIMEKRQEVSMYEFAYMEASLADNKDKQIRIHVGIDLFNEHVATIKSNMNEYARSGTRQFIRDSIQLYTNEMRENLDRLNNDKYARMAVERSNKPTTYTLFQEVATIGSWMMDDIEPQVVRFAIGKKLAAPEKRESEAEFVPPAIPNIAAAAAVAADLPAVLAEPEPVSDLPPMDAPVVVAEPTVIDDDDVSDAESEDGEPLPRIQIGETVDTSSYDGFIPPFPPPISDMELSSSDEGFVQPPPPADDMEDSSSDGYIPPPPPMEELEDSSND